MTYCRRVTQPAGHTTDQMNEHCNTFGVKVCSNICPRASSVPGSEEVSDSKARGLKKNSEYTDKK